MMSYAKCLQHLSCNITNRGKKVFKHATIGLLSGAASGAALGALITGCRYGVVHNDSFREYKADHYKEYGCTLNTTNGIICPDDATKNKLDSAAENFRYQNEQAWLKNVVPWLVSGLTISGAAVGLLIGIYSGYRAPLPLEEQPSIRNYHSIV